MTDSMGNENSASREHVHTAAHNDSTACVHALRVRITVVKSLSNVDGRVLRYLASLPFSGLLWCHFEGCSPSLNMPTPRTILHSSTATRTTVMQLWYEIIYPIGPQRPLSSPLRIRRGTPPSSPTTSPNTNPCPFSTPKTPALGCQPIVVSRSTTLRCNELFPQTGLPRLGTP